jgi:actin-binding protein IPP
VIDLLIKQLSKKEIFTVIESGRKIMPPLNNNNNNPNSNPFNTLLLAKQDNDSNNNNNQNSSNPPTLTTTTANPSVLVTGPEQRCFASKQYAQNLLQNLNTIRKDSRFCDVDIIVGGKDSDSPEQIIHAHKFILSASSAYFEAMFRPDLRANFDEGKQKAVTLHSISPDIVKSLIDFIYSGRIEITQVSVKLFFCNPL